ncbi:MAG: phosphatidylserine decarboxylase family protein [Bacteroidota bacterium]
MRIHREGLGTILISLVIVSLINIPLYLFSPFIWWIDVTILVTTLVCFGIVVRFFRFPNRELTHDKNVIVSGADGVVVAIEEVDEDRFLFEKRIQVSVFMSLHNVHINWFPVSGKVIKDDYYSGRYLIARNPKSSFLNEHTTVIIQPEGREPILVRQIAGFVARRIVCYATEGMDAEQSTQLGFIKFGSRVDILLPLHTELLVNINEKVRGGITPIARFQS